MNKKLRLLAIGLLLLSGLVTFISSCSKDDAEPAEVSSLIVKTAPLKTDYKVGETLDLTGLVLALKLEDGTSMDFTFSEFSDEGITCSPANGSVVPISTTSIKITHTESSKNVSQSISVTELDITKIEIKTVPAITEYYEEDNLNLGGLVVTLTKEDNTTEDVELSSFKSKGIICTPEHESELILNTSAVKIEHELSGKSVDQAITVNPLVLDNIEIKESGRKDYVLDEIMDISGLIVTLNYESGKTKDVAFSDFEDNSLTCVPENGSIITVASNGYTITHSISGKNVIQYLNLGFVKDIEDNSYNTVKIGDQVWMAKNLKTTKYNNGSEISLVEDNTTWTNLTTEAYSWYNNSTAVQEAYGILYNFYAVETNKLCPEGWHVPTYDEWTELSTYLGGEDIAGGKLKSTEAIHWASPNTGATNETGFFGVGSGSRNSDGLFQGAGYTGYYWSSTEYNTSYAWFTKLSFNFASLNDNWVMYGDVQKYGFSVRCLRD